MNARDPHQALKPDIVAKHNAGYVEVVLARLQWSKNEVGYSLHVNPTSYSTAGLQKTDFLAYLGFQASNCAFTSGGRCYVKMVDEGFDVERFATAFNRAYELISEAEGGLRACGYILPQPEGWGFFFGKQSGGSYQPPPRLMGDNHTASKIERMKESQDDQFFYRFTWIDAGHEKGWVTHYRAKHQPLSSEMSAVFKMLQLTQFDECPEFNFEPCFYRSLAFVSRDNSVWDSNVDTAHGWFDAHATRFSPAIRSLLGANEVIENAGLSFLLKSNPRARMQADIQQKIVLPQKAARSSALRARDITGNLIPAAFDVALSFAGTEREYAKQLAEALRAAGFAVFYDDFYPEYLWGKNLTGFLDEVYRKKARYCVVFISKEYKERKWTSLEMRSAQARAFEEKGNDYILPIRVDDTDLDGLPPTVAYISADRGMDKIAALLVKKLESGVAS